MNRHGVGTADARIVSYLSNAVDAQLESLLRRTFTSAQQRADMARDQPGMVVTGDVRRGLAEIRKQDEQKAALKQAAEDAALARAEEQQGMDDETKERIKAKREAELERATRNQTSVALAVSHLMQTQALGQPTRALLPSTRVGQRGKIATLRDVIAVLERDPLLNKSTLLYTLMEKMHASNLQS
eukprot:jgi/Astpho2/5978/Aster-03940